MRQLLVIIFLSLMTCTANLSAASEIALAGMAGKKPMGSDSLKAELMLKKGDSLTQLARPRLNEALLDYQQCINLASGPRRVALISHAVLGMAVIYAGKQNLADCRRYYLKAIDYSSSPGDLNARAAAWRQVAQKLAGLNNAGPPIQSEVIACLEKERQMELTANDRLHAMLALKNEAKINEQLRKLNLAEKQSMLALTEAKAIHYPHLDELYFLLADLAENRGDFKVCLFYRIRMLKSIAAEKDLSLRTLYLYKLAEAYRGIGEYRQSLIYYQRSLTTKKIEYDDDFIYILFYRMAVAYVALDRPNLALDSLNKEIARYPPHKMFDWYNVYKAKAACFEGLRQYTKTEFFLLKVIGMNEDFGSLHITSAMRCLDSKRISQFYFNQHRYQLARVYLKKAQAEPLSNITILEQSRLFLLVFKIDSVFGEYPLALTNLLQYKRLKDSIFNLKNSAVISDMEIQFQAEQQQKDIKLLQKEIGIAKARGERKKNAANWLLAIFILGCVIVFFIFNRNRLFNRTIFLFKKQQKQLRKANEELEGLINDNEWLIKEVHHRVKNNLHIVTSLLHSQSQYLKNGAASDAIMDSRHRVHAVSIIHQKMYKAGNLSKVYVPDLVNELIDYFKDLPVPCPQLVFVPEVEPLLIDVSDALPLILIINELIINFIKDCEAHDADEIFKIRLSRISGAVYQLSIEFTGHLWIKMNSINNSQSFGWMLIKRLLNDMNGFFHLTHDSNGTKLFMDIKLQPAKVG